MNVSLYFEGTFVGLETTISADVNAHEKRKWIIHGRRGRAMMIRHSFIKGTIILVTRNNREEIKLNQILVRSCGFCV